MLMSPIEYSLHLLLVHCTNAMICRFQSCLKINHSLNLKIETHLNNYQVVSVKWPYYISYVDVHFLCSYIHIDKVFRINGSMIFAFLGCYNYI